MIPIYRERRREPKMPSWLYALSAISDLAQGISGGVMDWKKHGMDEERQDKLMEQIEQTMRLEDEKASRESAEWDVSHKPTTTETYEHAPRVPLGGYPEETELDVGRRREYGPSLWMQEQTRPERIFEEGRRRFDIEQEPGPADPMDELRIEKLMQDVGRLPRPERAPSEEDELDIAYKRLRNEFARKGEFPMEHWTPQGLRTEEVIAGTERGLDDMVDDLADMYGELDAAMTRPGMDKAKEGVLGFLTQGLPEKIDMQKNSIESKIRNRPFYDGLEANFLKALDAGDIETAQELYGMAMQTEEFLPATQRYIEIAWGRLLNQ